MSADICCFHTDDLDGCGSLPEGWYVGAFRGAHCEEATGPYKDETTAAIKMTVAGGCVWMFGDSTTGNYTWDGTRELFVPRTFNPVVSAFMRKGERL